MTEVQDRNVKRFVVCADDYGHSGPTSAKIAALLESRALNATSCLVETPTWPADGETLRQLTRETREMAIGLHLNLTEHFGYAPIAPMRIALDASPGFEEAVYARFVSQWERFVDVFGRAPDFIDGHQHVHLAFAPRAALFRLIESVAFAGWVRQCRTSSSRLTSKRLVLDGLSEAFRAETRRRNVRCNPGFGGLRRFRSDEDMIALWKRDLAAMRDGGVLMVHPGADTPDDAIGACRQHEAEMLPRLRDVFAELGFSTQCDARTAW